MLPAPHLELDIPRRILQEYRELILNKRSIKATRGLWSYGWHIDRYGLRLAGPQYALSIDTRSLSKADSEYSLDKRAVSAGEYRIPGVVQMSSDAIKWRRSDGGYGHAKHHRTCCRIPVAGGHLGGALRMPMDSQRRRAHNALNIEQNVSELGSTVVEGNKLRSERLRYVTRARPADNNI